MKTKDKYSSLILMWAFVDFFCYSVISYSLLLYWNYLQNVDPEYLYRSNPP